MIGIREILIFIGKPFYFLLSHIILVLLFIAYWVGHLTRLVLVKIFSFRLPKIAFPKIHIRPRPISLICFFALLLAAGYWLLFRGLPSPKDLVNRNQEVSTKIYDRNGILLYTIYKDKNRTPVSLSQIPSQVRLATLAAKDAEFYSHPGFSFRGILRAAAKNLKNGKISGGSTITQQLVKNALLSSEKTLRRKFREIILAVEVEITYSKDQILEMYLNEVSYGGTAYGIREASRLYFGKDVTKLSLVEAALLAGLPQAPSKYSPFGANPDLAFSRMREVLHLMRINKYISVEEQEEALSQPISFAPNRIEIKAPHFVMYVKNLLAEKYGEEILEQGGLEVITSLDYSIQALAEKVVAEEVEKLKNLNVKNGAVVILNPHTGEILAMVGSKDYFDTQNDGNVNVTLRSRQPGSSIKIINYAYALGNGYTPASVLDDSPVTFVVPGQPPYSPKNYDDKYRGKIPLRSALAESRNIPAVKVLATYGVSKMIDLGQKMGITTWEDPSRFGLSLTLGGGEIRLIDLAQVYATAANYGKRPNINSILKVKDYKGKILQEADQTEKVEQVLDPRVAFLLIDILSDNSARSLAFGSNSMLTIPGHPEVAVKTGTSNNLKDNLTLGFNQKYLVAVWVGNNDSTPMARIASGVTGAAPIWNKIMRALLTEEKSQSWEIPPRLVKNQTCAGKAEWFLEENQPKITCPTPVRQGDILPEAASTSL